MVPESYEVRTTFDGDLDQHHRAAPAVPVSLIGDLCTLVDPRPEHRLLQIGAGTGKVTMPLAAIGCQIVALEPDPRLAAYAARWLAVLDNVEVVTADFTTWQLPAEPFDVVLAADSYRALDPAVRVDKVVQAVRPGGWLAVLETHHVAGDDSPLLAAAQDCLRRADPDGGWDLRLPDADRVPRRAGTAGSGWFEPPTFRRCQWEVTYTASQYVDLVLAHPGHRQPAGPVRAQLAECVRHLVEHRFVGVARRCMTQLWVVRRREVRSNLGRRATLRWSG